MSSPTLDAALDYLSRGWAPIPLCPPDHEKVPGEHQKKCASPGKAPLWPWKQYQDKAPTESHIKLFWTRNPNANVGIVMGPVSNLVGLDIDGQEGEQMLAKLCPGELPNTLEFTTPGGMGSRRYLFKCPTQPLHIKSFGESKEAMRILAKGSQTVAPPSTHATGGAYEWVPGHAPGQIEPQDFPQWLVGFLTKPETPIATHTNGTANPWTRAAAYLAKCDPAIAGEGGHNQTFKVACKLIKGFALSTEDALQLLKTIYNPRCQPPWTDKELEHKIESAANVPGDTGFLINASKPTKPTAEPQWEAHSRAFATVKTTTVEWLWRNWIPLGKLTILDGDPGLGKSTLLLDIATRVSTTGVMPDGALGISGSVIVMSAEDAADDTIKPRLEAAGANLNAIIDLSHITWCGEERPVEIPKDFPVIAKTIAKHNARLMIIDPLMAFLFGADANKDQEIRRVLYKLSKIAEKYRCAIVCMRHLNKGNSQKAIYRGNSSIGVIGHARAGLIVAEDPDDDHKRILAVSKCNLSAKPKSLRFTLEAHGDVCRIGWCGTSSYGADQLLAQPQSESEKEDQMESQSKLEMAKSILASILSHGPKEIKACKKECSDAGLSTRTAERAASKLGLEVITVTDELGANAYFYQLPNGEPQQTP